MKLSKYFILSCLAVLVAVSALASTTKTVKMQSITYEPKSLEIKVGDGVKWDNVAHTDHSASADDGSTFETGMIAAGAKSKTIIMTKAGTYTYHCSVHGKTMHGQIVVTP